jgi:hypothetical protein
MRAPAAPQAFTRPGDRIEHLYETHVAPVSRPQAEKQKADAKRQLRSALLQATKSGDFTGYHEAVQAAKTAGVNLASLKHMKVPGDIVLFKALPTEDQVAILRQSDADERKRYLPSAHKEARRELARQE